MDFDHPPAEPLSEMKQWLDDARATELPNPNAMTLATVDPAGTPSARTVLLKALDERGAVFFTNRRSRKGVALAAHPRAALLFHWDVLTRQIIVEGPVSEVDDAQSDAYFASRPRASQIAAWASRQSQPASNRGALDRAVAEIDERYAGREVPRPPHWGGFRVALDRVEFWQGHPFRLHDRIAYVTDGAGGWQVQRLQP